MLDFLKQRKIIIVIAILGGMLLSYKIYNSNSKYTELENEEVLVQETKTEENTKEEKIAIHITGEVKNPGIVRVNEGSRIEDIIKEAGGLTENADITDVNLAYVVEDGQKIRIPSIEDENISKENIITKGAGESVIVSDENSELTNIQVVNINTATQNEIESLPGIGPSIATKIIEYRTQNGKFKSIEDIKNVTGIGENKFEKIKEYIKVK